MEGDRRVLRIGAAGGILGAVLLLVAALLGLALLPPLGTEQLLVEFGSRSSRATMAAFVQGLSLVGAFLSIALFLSLHSSLRETNPEYALSGLLFYVLGIALIGIAIAGPLISLPRNAADYVAGTPEQKTAIVAATRAANGVFLQAIFIGSLFAALSVLSLGAVMLGNRNFGRGYGGLSLLFGVLGLVVVPVSLFVPVSVVPNLLLIVYLLVFGWRVFVLSKGT